ncbi:MAG: uracil phosphoribosyltransferase [Candidatus Kapabacteria bacterium]|jgi:uracil phosphoribosyltransferase|nr:uracil phosphoribosyltransferase [Candidatus Kapabacteria bacterium]
MVTILSGTAVAADITRVRDIHTPMAAFRSSVRRIGIHLGAEVGKHLPSTTVRVSSPIEETDGLTIDGRIVVLPVLRAGLGLVDAFLELLPEAAVGYIGLKRSEETLRPTEYYRNIPPIDESTTVVIIDPMLATGGSMVATIDAVRGIATPRQIMAAVVIASPEGIATVEHHAPDVRIIAAQLDRGLNADGYIVPGLGDAGDRLFGT